jgi:hypothetical protein
MWFEFVLYALATVGMTAIIVHGVIFQPFRSFAANWAEKCRERREQKSQATGKLPRRSVIEWFNDLIHCAQCTGFWSGLFCGTLVVAANNMSNNACAVQLLLWFCLGLAGSFLSFFFLNLNDWIFFQKERTVRQLEEQSRLLAEQHNHAE